jgi:hypothetical protein
MIVQSPRSVGAHKKDTGTVPLGPVTSYTSVRETGAKGPPLASRLALARTQVLAPPRLG